MKKRLSILLVITMASSMLWGCGSTGQSASKEGEVESMRLMVWAPSEDQSKDSGEWL